MAATLFGAGELYYVSQETPADVSFYLKKLRENPEKDLRLAKDESAFVKTTADKSVSAEATTDKPAFAKATADKEEKTKYPDNKILKVPFIVQAPLQNWQIHKESCEEAAFLTLISFQKGENLSKESQNQELVKMKNFQKEHYGAEKDLIGNDFVKFSQDYAGVSLKTLENPTLEDIKREINAEKPLIIPVIAKYLKNPHYPHQGYHMLVIIGYEGDEIITNDPGTYRGAGFKYSFQKIKKAGEDYGNIAFY